jgi:acetoin utilization protein AcuB
MLVKKWMRTEFLTVDTKDSIETAISLMRSQGIKELLVLDSGKLAGVVTEAKVRRFADPVDVSPGNIPDQVSVAVSKVGDLLEGKPMAIPIDYTMEEAAEFLLDHKLEVVPVVESDGTPVGVITQQEILAVLLSLSGARKKGIQLGFLLENRPGSIKEVTDIIREYGCRLVSVLTTFDDHTGSRHVYIRACNCDRDSKERMMKELEAKATLLYLVDHDDRKKKFYKDYQRPPTEMFIG